jgi:hypothetical protein
MTRLTERLRSYIGLLLSAIKRNRSMETNSYIVLTGRVSQYPYELREGYILLPIKPLPKMFEGFSFGIPHHYKAIMALQWQGDKFPESFNIYRNLAVFHSFVSDDPETYQYTTERAIREVLPGSELNAPEGSFQALDYNRFTMPIPILSSEDLTDFEEYVEPPFGNGSQEICYRDSFEFFSGLENSENKKRVQLHNMIFSYVFIRGIWDISNISLIYENEDLIATFYLAILEGILGEPPKCDQEFTCIPCNKKLQPHYKIEWREYLTLKLNNLESGWGDRYINSIMALRDNRNRFAHGASYWDVSKKLRDIYDKKYYAGQELGETDLAKEAELSTLKDSIEILERTVRKGLIDFFLSEYEVWHQRQ